MTPGMRNSLTASTVLLLAIMGCGRVVESPIPASAQQAQYRLQQAIITNNKDSVDWAHEFLSRKGMLGVPPIDFDRTRHQEQAKLDRMLKFWHQLPNKEKLDQEFRDFLMFQSPKWGEEWK